MRVYKSNKFDIGQVFLFVLWPMLGLINSIRNRNSAWAKNIFWLFCIYYGFTFVLKGDASDSVRYAESFVQLSKTNLTFSNFVSYLYSEETNYIDILQPLVNFIVSRFTSDSRFLFAAFGLIFGYFYSRNLWLLFSLITRRTSLITGLYILVFAFLNPIWNINAFRFATAAHIFVFGVLTYLVKENKNGLWIAASSIFVHFTFMAPVLVLLFYTFIGNKYNFLFAVFIVTLFISEINVNIVKEQFEFLPAIFQKKSEIYLVEGAITNEAKVLSATHWYIRYLGLTLTWISYIFIISLFLKRKFLIKKSKMLSDVFGFILLFGSFANLVNLLPQGVRFLTLSNILVFFFISVMPSIVNMPPLILKLRKIFIPFLILIMVVNIRKSFESAGLLTLFGNPVMAPFIKGDIPLIDIVKGFFVK